MQALTPTQESTRLKLSKQIFRDGWLLTIDKEEFGEIRFGSLRLKASGKSAEGEYEIKKEKQSYSVLRDGKVIASYVGKTNGSGSLEEVGEFTIVTEMTSSVPGSGTARVNSSDGTTLVWTETTWNLMGVPHCDLIIEPGAPAGDSLWGAIMILLRIVVEHSLWNVSKDAARKAFVVSESLR